CPSQGRRTSSRRANAAKSSMLVSTYQAIKYTLTNQISLFFPARRVTGNIQPNLQDVARGEPIGSNDSSKDRLGRGGLPNDGVGNLCGGDRHQVFPRG